MPDLKKIALIAEIIGGAGIIVSVLYLGYQVSQNTANIRAANTLAITTELNGLRLSRMENPELAQLVHTGRQDTTALSAVDRSRFFAHALNIYALLDAITLMERDGLISPDVAYGMNRGLCNNVSEPGYVQVWEEVGLSFSEELRRKLEECRIR